MARQAAASHLIYKYCGPHIFPNPLVFAAKIIGQVLHTGAALNTGDMNANGARAHGNRTLLDAPLYDFQVGV